MGSGENRHRARTGAKKKKVTERIHTIRYNMNRLVAFAGTHNHPCDRSEASHQVKALRNQLADATERLNLLNRRHGKE